MQTTKHSILSKALQLVASVASGLGEQKKLFILIYHRVLDVPDFMRPGEVDKAAFTWQMELLSSYFNVLPLHEALQKMQDNTLPSRAACITFDDGYADNYTNALPILKRFDLTATFFIASGFLDGGRMWNDTIIEAIRNLPQSELDLSPLGLGQFDISAQSQKCQAAAQIIQKIKHMPPTERDECTAFIAAQSQNLPNNLMMTTAQLKHLHSNGMTVAGHTVTHPILAKLSAIEALKEINDNKAALEALLETKLNIFAYPNGKPGQDYLADQIDLVRQAGYQAAVSTQWGVASKATDIWQLPRFTPWDSTPTKFMLRMAYQYCAVKNF